MLLRNLILDIGRNHFSRRKLGVQIGQLESEQFRLIYKDIFKMMALLDYVGTVNIEKII